MYIFLLKILPNNMKKAIMLAPAQSLPPWKDKVCDTPTVGLMQNLGDG